MNYKEYADFIQENYKPLHHNLYSLRKDSLADSFAEAIEAKTSDKLMDVCKEVHTGVFVFDMVKPDFCTSFLEELNNFEKWCSQNQLQMVRPNTMNNYGVILNSIGFDIFLQQLMVRCIAPFSSLLYPDVGGDSLDSHYGFIVEYQEGKDVSLDYHVDASDVTLNICLGKEFNGGELYFRGVRCGICQQTPSLPEEEFEITHIPGQAILHRGKHRHGAKPITSGERYNLILWCNSSYFNQQQDSQNCPDWCGWHEVKHSLLPDHKI